MAAITDDCDSIGINWIDHRLPVMLQPPKKGEKVDLEDRALFYTSLTSALLCKHCIIATTHELVYS